MEEISKIILEYMKEENTDYSYLISGEWGVGKTYYIQNSLIPTLKNNEYKCLYISLNGIISPKEISKKIILSILETDNPKLKPIFINEVLEFGEKFNFGGTGKFFKGIDNLIFNGNIIEKLELSKKILIFDDLERISKKTDYSEILGYIFDNFIVTGTKVLVVCNEEEIKDETSKKDIYFLKIKEKYFRRSFYFRPKSKDLLKEFFNNKYSTNEDYFKFLITQIDGIVKIFDTLKENNLRSLDFSIKQFEYIYKEKDKIELVNQYLETIFFSTVILSIEFKNGNLEKVNLDMLDQLTYISYKELFSENDSSENKKEYHEIFREKYIIKCQLNFVLLKSVLEMVLTGILNINSFTIEVEETFAPKKTKWEKALSEIKFYRQLEQKDLLKNVEIIIDALKEGRYALNILPYIYTILLFIKDQKFLPKFEYDIISIFEVSIKKSKNSNLIYNDFGYDQIRQSFSEEYLGDKYFIELVDKIKSISIQKEEFDNKDALSIILSKFNKSENTYEEFRRINTFSFFQPLHDTGVYKEVLDLNNLGIYNLQKFIQSKILGRVNAGENHYREKIYLELLSKYIKVKLHEYNFDNYRIKRFEELIDTLDKAANHIERTTK